MTFQLAPLVAQLQPSATIAAAAKAKELVASGVKVFDFTLGEPDFTTPEHICGAARAAMQAGHTHYTPAVGIPELRKAIVNSVERDHGLVYEPAQVTVSCGAKHAIHNVLTTLCTVGDEVVIPTPYWVSYSALVELTGATPVLVDTTLESGFQLTAEQLANAVTDRTKLVMLNNPCNPTGVAYDVATLEALAKVVVEKNLLVLADEIYEKLIYEGSEFRCFATFGDDVRARTIIVNGVSKAYAMTGWRIGWTIAPLEISKAITSLQSQQTSNPSSISQYAAVAALEGPQDCVTEMLAAFAKRRAYTMERLAAIPNLAYPTPSGAFYAFFDVSAYFGKPLGGGRVVDDASDFCTALLEVAHVALVTGDAFGAPGFVRLSFATDLDTLAAGFDRLATFLAGK